MQQKLVIDSLQCEFNEIAPERTDFSSVPFYRRFCAPAARASPYARAIPVRSQRAVHRHASQNVAVWLYSHAQNFQFIHYTAGAIVESAYCNIGSRIHNQFVPRRVLSFLKRNRVLFCFSPALCMRIVRTAFIPIATALTGS